MLKKLLKKEVSGKKVLDLGCGSGIYTRVLADWGAKVAGMDNSRTMIALAKQENPGIPFHKGNALRMPYQDKSFDIVYSAMLVHYLKHLRPLFREISRILKKDGLFVFSFHHPVHECLERKTQKGKTVFTLSPYFHNQSYRWKMIGNMELISFHHTFETVINTLNDAGFVIQRLVEPRPPVSSQKIDPRSYQFTKDYPSFCAIKAVKIRNR